MSRNPWKLPESITPALLKRKHLSVPRNRFLAERLFYIRYIEHWGRGTNRILEAMREHKLPDPIFEELTSGLNVTLPGPGKAFEKEIEDTKLHKLDLNDRQKKAVEYVKKDGKITKSLYCQINEIGETYAKKEINDLISQRVFRRLGGSRDIHYILVTE